MKKPKYFFSKKNLDPEFCHSLNFYKEKIEGGEEKAFDLIEAKPDFGSGFYFCRYFDFAGEVKYDDICGKNCEAYKPRNGKNGRCKHSTHCYTLGEREYKYDGKTLIEIKP